MTRADRKNGADTVASLSASASGERTPGVSPAGSKRGTSRERAVAPSANRGRKAKSPGRADFTRPEPSKREAEAIAAAADRVRGLPRRVRTEFEGDRTRPPHSDEIGHLRRLQDIMSSDSLDFLARAMSDLHDVACLRGTGEGRDAQGLGAGLAFVAAIEPKNEMEAALAIQMAGVHHLTTEVLGMARRTDNADKLNLYTSLAVKLARTFTTQTEALSKLRGAGKQVVEVVHIHKQVYVAPGGQAIVGDVHHGGGAGEHRGSQTQPHAPSLPYEPGVPMSGEDAHRAAVSGARSAGAA